jgi:hypothetical protein
MIVATLCRLRLSTVLSQARPIRGTRWFLLLLSLLPTGLLGAQGDDLAAIRERAENGDGVAFACLGDAYRFGQGVAQDPAAALMWYRLAAELDIAAGQLGVGAMYASGEGVPKDMVVAVRFYRLAADNGDERAQLLLAYAYARGEGVPKDRGEAAKWYRLAAERGSKMPRVILEPEAKVDGSSAPAPHDNRKAGAEGLHAASNLPSARSNSAQPGPVQAPPPVAQTTPGRTSMWAWLQDSENMTIYGRVLHFLIFLSMMWWVGKYFRLGDASLSPQHVRRVPRRVAWWQNVVRGWRLRLADGRWWVAGWKSKWRRWQIRRDQEIVRRWASAQAVGSPERYIVDKLKPWESFQPDLDLTEYLNRKKRARSSYRLVSVVCNGGEYVMVWEWQDPAAPASGDARGNEKPSAYGVRSFTSRP